MSSEVGKAGSNSGKKKEANRHKRKLAYRARHRLLSIRRDSKCIQQRILTMLKDGAWTINEDWPWIPNEQCGSWYLPPPTSFVFSSCYFKSTDGHVGTYAISLKRLNLASIELLYQHGGCFVVDSSVRKLLPDSFSRTIPIWACVMNRIVQKYRQELNLATPGDWDTALHTPASIVTPEEHLEISNLIESRVELLYQSKAIVDPKRLVQLISKPIRATWVSNGRHHQDTMFENNTSEHVAPGKFLILVCCNPSFYFEDDSGRSKSSLKRDIQWMGDDAKAGYFYTPGAADDQESWARRLTSEEFWNHIDVLTNPSLNEDEIDALIDKVVEEQQRNNLDGSQSNDSTNFDKIGSLNLWIGSRRSGRPPDCWNNFEAILNVTENEYSNMSEAIKAAHKPCFYLQLAVAEGKRDRTELERLMPVALLFVIQHLQQGRRVLVHCAQGKDRSVAVVLALVALACPPSYPLHLRDGFENWNLDHMPRTSRDSRNFSAADNTVGIAFLDSGLSRCLIDVLQAENGKYIFLAWAHQQLDAPMITPLVNKEILRIALHLVRQDREIADPTRSTMQKLNRFFMSSPMYLGS